MDARSKANLKRECRRRGLSTSGEKTDLVQRLREPSPLKISATTLPSKKEYDIDCVVAVSIPYDTPSAMISTARTQLAIAAQRDPLEEEERAGKTVIANPRGGSFLAHMAAEVAALRQDHLTLQQRHLTLQYAFQSKHKELELTAVGFRDFRHRFISVYKRDILGEADGNDQTYIRSGNTVVHSGNCKRDAELYSGPKPRSDHSVFEKLYGVRPETAANIDDFSTICLLDKHATIVANPQYRTTPTFDNQFKKFITALSERGFPNEFLETRDVLTDAYWALSREAAEIMGR
ncbi:uncharacterized protein TRUGW13939_00709 [Talaromyces rugulosus]|uniref:SAP domain-containing protein n=1 Tax=Talaromyces rugulosus TaxID=121627 RepID=A0A7H8QIA4_TALRU|nr:uncharacterized protein TRUGW13939_00709 [Talaromyces rugulosus]QKX53630.1 hypothetical protein TRUGW13939_00709 [Talaromyces rugulosus]